MKIVHPFDCSCRKCADGHLTRVGVALMLLILLVLSAIAGADQPSSPPSPHHHGGNS